MNAGRGRRRFLALGGALASTWLAAPRLGRAHPYHTTRAEARLDHVTHTLQVSLRVLPEDLEEAVRRATGRRRALESMDAEDIVAYLASTMRWRHDGGTRMAPRWAGSELDARVAWLHFDYLLPSRARRVDVDHRVFFELEDDQINTLAFLNAGPDGTRRTVSLHRRESTASFELPVAPAKLAR